MEKTRTHIYPSWYWLWNYRTRYISRVITGVLFLIVLYGLTKEMWLLNLLLVPAFFILVVTSGDEKFKRGHVPSRIRKQMIKRYDGQLHKTEALYLLGRVYEKSASMSPKKPRDLWLTRFYFGLAFMELSKSEQDDPAAYNELRDFIFNRYY